MIGLVRAQFGRRRTRDRAVRDHVRLFVAPARQRVDLRLVDVLQHREAAGHVAIQRAVTHARLALVAGREHQPAELVRQRHERVAADARLQVLLGRVGRAANERWCQRLLVRLHGIGDGDALEPHAQGRRERGGVLGRDRGRVGRRHRHAHDMSGAQGIDGDGCRERRVDAARKSEHDRLEPVLPHVVAYAQHERGVDVGFLDRLVAGGACGERWLRGRSLHGLAPGLGQMDARHRIGLVERALLAEPCVVQARVEHLVEIDIGDHQVLFERLAFGDHFAILIEDHAAAIEHDLVLPADQIDVAHDGDVIRGAGRDHAAAAIGLAGMVGRRRQVQDHLGAAAHHLFLGRSAREPDVLAHVDAEHHAVEREHDAVALGREVAVLVEHAIVGQVALARGTDEAAVVEDRRRVVEVDIALERAHGHRHAGGMRGERTGVLETGLDEPGLQEQVLGRVARQDHLGEREQLDAQRACAGDGVDDPGGIAVEVADGRIDLGETDAEHSHVDCQCGAAGAGLATRGDGRWSFGGRAESSLRGRPAPTT